MQAFFPIFKAYVEKQTGGAFTEQETEAWEYLAAKFNKFVKEYLEEQGKAWFDPDPFFKNILPLPNFFLDSSVYDFSCLHCVKIYALYLTLRFRDFFYIIQEISHITTNAVFELIRCIVGFFL